MPVTVIDWLIWAIEALSTPDWYRTGLVHSYPGDGMHAPELMPLTPLNTPNEYRTAMATAMMSIAHP
jgi:hypothetical protein